MTPTPVELAAWSAEATPRPPDGERGAALLGEDAAPPAALPRVPGSPQGHGQLGAGGGGALTFRRSPVKRATAPGGQHLAGPGRRRGEARPPSRGRTPRRAAGRRESRSDPGGARRAVTGASSAAIRRPAELAEGAPRQ